MPNPVILRRLIYTRAVVVAGPDTTPPEFGSAEEGNVANVTVAVVFSETISSPTADYVTGVTILVNAVAATISSGTLQGDNQTVYYVLSVSSDPDDVVTWEYSAALGDIEDSSGNDLQDVAAQAVDNNVGEHWRFDHIYNSMQLAAL